MTQFCCRIKCCGRRCNADISITSQIKR